MFQVINYIYVYYAGGTFALYSLICRYAKVSLIPKDQPEDRQLSNYRLDTPSSQLKRAQKIKEKLETSTYAKTVLFLVTILGTSMVIGDGVLTPCISVLSAVSGIQSVGTGNTLNQGNPLTHRQEEYELEAYLLHPDK